MDLKKLFGEHIRERTSGTAKILAAEGFEGIVLDSGLPGLYFEDDQHWHHRPNHHFAHWCPVPAPGSFIHFRPGHDPVLYFVSPRDYWHESPDLGPSFWQDEFAVKVIESDRVAWEEFRKLKNTVYHGSREDVARSYGLKTGLPSTFIAHLNWERSFKTAYEVECTLIATRRAARGHEAARSSFEAGSSEIEIYNAFLQATGDLEQDLPYTGIVCLDEKSSVLHYHRRRRDARDGKVLLIDAGTQEYGYACDITRTWYRENCIKEFREIVDGVNSLQKEVCASVRPGVSMVDLHSLTHEKVADLLLRVGVLRDITKDGVLEKGLTNVFFPHGIGHMLGLLVHDVGGKQKDAVGTPVETPHLTADPRFKFLRSHRRLDAGNLVTVEPGVYFISMLLDPQRDSRDSKHFHWSLIEDLMPCGGVRIEDDVLVTKDGHRNLTREVLAE